MSDTQLFQKLVVAIEAILEDYDLTDRTGPTIKVLGQSRTLAYNFFLEEREELLKTLKNVVDSQLTNIKGEIIRLEGAGTIIDSGLEAFQVLYSITWDVFFYKAEDFAYIRVSHEKDPVKGAEWLSLDADYVVKSAWFQDNN